MFRIRIHPDPLHLPHPNPFQKMWIRVAKKLWSTQLKIDQSYKNIIFVLKEITFCFLHMNKRLIINKQKIISVFNFFGSGTGSVISRKGSGSRSKWNGSTELLNFIGMIFLLSSEYFLRTISFYINKSTCVFLYFWELLLNYFISLYIFFYINVYPSIHLIYLFVYSYLTKLSKYDSGWWLCSWKYK